MTILNDTQIKSRCLKPTHAAVYSTDNAGVDLLYKTDGRYLCFNSGTYYTTDFVEMLGGSIIEIDDEIIRAQKWKPMITPFSEKLSEVGKISHGLSSFGYDATCSNHYKIAVTENEFDPGMILDPKNVDPASYVDFEGDICVIPPHGFALTNTQEIFDIPEDVLSICMAKSTYARIGLVVGVTPLEPGWRGSVTIELSNTTDLPIKVYSREGICQFLFFRGSGPAEIPYNKRGGKYMNQEGIVLSRVLK